MEKFVKAQTEIGEDRDTGEGSTRVSRETEVYNTFLASRSVSVEVGIEEV